MIDITQQNQTDDQTSDITEARLLAVSPTSTRGLKLLVLLIGGLRIVELSTQYELTVHVICISDIKLYTLNHKKRDILFLTITLANRLQFL